MYKKKTGGRVVSEEAGICEKYQRSFKERKHFNRHVNECGIVCEECNKSFSRKSVLKRHKETVHGTNPELSCDNCNKFFRLDLLKNIEINTKIRKLSFTVCLQFNSSHLGGIHKVHTLKKGGWGVAPRAYTLYKY